MVNANDPPRNPRVDTVPRTGEPAATTPGAAPRRPNRSGWGWGIAAVVIVALLVIWFVWDRNAVTPTADVAVPPGPVAVTPAVPAGTAPPVPTAVPPAPPASREAVTPAVPPAAPIVPPPSTVPPAATPAPAAPNPG